MAIVLHIPRLMVGGYIGSILEVLVVKTRAPNRPKATPKVEETPPDRPKNKIL